MWSLILSFSFILLNVSVAHASQRVICETLTDFSLCTAANGCFLDGADECETLEVEGVEAEGGQQAAELDCGMVSLADCATTQGCMIDEDECTEAEALEAGEPVESELEPVEAEGVEPVESEFEPPEAEDILPGATGSGDAGLYGPESEFEPPEAEDILPGMAGSYDNSGISTISTGSSTSTGVTSTSTGVTTTSTGSTVSTGISTGVTTSSGSSTTVSTVTHTIEVVQIPTGGLRKPHQITEGGSSTGVATEEQSEINEEVAEANQEQTENGIEMQSEMNEEVAEANEEALEYGVITGAGGVTASTGGDAGGVTANTGGVTADTAGVTTDSTGVTTDTGSVVVDLTTPRVCTSITAQASCFGVATGPEGEQPEEGEIEFVCVWHPVAGVCVVAVLEEFEGAAAGAGEAEGQEVLESEEYCPTVKTMAACTAPCRWYGTETTGSCYAVDILQKTHSAEEPTEALKFTPMFLLVVGTAFLLSVAGGVVIGVKCLHKRASDTSVHLVDLDYRQV